MLLTTVFLTCVPFIAYAANDDADANDATHDIEVEWYIGDWEGNEQLLESRFIEDVPNGEYSYKDLVWNPDGGNFYREYGIYPIIQVNGRYYLLSYMDVRCNYPMDNDAWTITFKQKPNHYGDDENAYIGIHYSEVKLATKETKDKIKVSVDGSANDNLIEPTTYQVYQIFDVRKSADVQEDVTTDETVGKTIVEGDEGFAYYIRDTDEWYDVIASMPQYFNLIQTTEEGLYNVALADGVEPQESTAIEIAAELEKHIDGKTSTTLTANEANMEMKPGYYLIVSPINSNLILATTNIDITEKAQYPTIEKTIAEEDINSAIGQLVHFTVNVNFPRGSKASAVITDVMDKGLTFKEITSINIDNYNIEITNNGFKINIDADTVKAFAADDEAVLTFEYTALVNKKAPINTDINNEVTLTYVNYVQSDSAKTSVTGIKILKYAADDEDKEVLSGAEFQILDENNNPVALYEIKPNAEYRLATEEDATSMDTFRTKKAIIIVSGLDADKQYKLREVTAPAGYNKLSSDVSMELQSDAVVTVEVANSKGTELPSTGGIGVIVIYIIGGILVIGVLIYFIINFIRRKKNSDV